jgi:MFS family permease
MRVWHRGLDGIHAFYANGLLRSLYSAMTSIFIPLFLYSLTSSLWAVIFYYIAQRIVVIIALFPISKMIEKIGFRHSIMVSVLFLVGNTICLYLAKDNFNFVYLAVLFEGLQVPIYWVSRDSALSQDIGGKEMGKSMGYLTVLENIASLLGPFVGGVIVATAGYKALFVFATLILVLSLIPLWNMPSHTHKNGVSLKGFWYFLTNGRYLHQAVGNFGAAMNDYGTRVIWPLILLFQGIKDEKLGAIYSMVAVVAIAMQYVTGPWFDRLRARHNYDDEGVYGFATVGVSIMWVARYFAHGIAQILPLDIFRQLFGSVQANFFADYLHLGGKRMGSIAFWVYMEIIYSMGAILMFSVMGLGIYLGIWKELVIGTIALWSLASIVMARESNL